VLCSREGLNANVLFFVFVLLFQARETPMHYAVHADATVIVDMLGWFGANVNLTNRVRRTTATRLQAALSDLRCAFQFGQTPLHYAKSADTARAVLTFTRSVAQKDKVGGYGVE